MVENRVVTNIKRLLSRIERKIFNSDQQPTNLDLKYLKIYLNDSKKLLEKELETKRTSEEEFKKLNLQISQFLGSINSKISERREKNSEIHVVGLNEELDENAFEFLEEEDTQIDATSDKDMKVVRLRDLLKFGKFLKLDKGEQKICIPIREFQNTEDGFDPKRNENYHAKRLISRLKIIKDNEKRMDNIYNKRRLFGELDEEESDEENDNEEVKEKEEIEKLTKDVSIFSKNLKERTLGIQDALNEDKKNYG